MDRSTPAPEKAGGRSTTPSGSARSRLESARDRGPVRRREPGRGEAGSVAGAGGAVLVAARRHGSEPSGVRAARRAGTGDAAPPGRGSGGRVGELAVPARPAHPQAARRHAGPLERRLEPVRETPAQTARWQVNLARPDLSPDMRPGRRGGAVRPARRQRTAPVLARGSGRAVADDRGDDPGRDHAAGPADGGAGYQAGCSESLHPRADWADGQLTIDTDWHVRDGARRQRSGAGALGAGAAATRPRCGTGERGSGVPGGHLPGRRGRPVRWRAWLVRAAR